VSNGPQLRPRGESLASHDDWWLSSGRPMQNLSFAVGSCRDSALAGNRRSVAGSRFRVRALLARSSLTSAERIAIYGSTIAFQWILSGPYGLALRRTRMEFGKSGYRAGRSSRSHRHRP